MQRGYRQLAPGFVIPVATPTAAAQERLTLQDICGTCRLEVRAGCELAFPNGIAARPDAANVRIGEHAKSCQTSREKGL